MHHTLCRNPLFIKDLIDNIGLHVELVDPIVLIQRIDPDLNIPHLRDSLVGLLQEYRMQINIQESCKRILVPDTYSLLLKQKQIHTKGIQIDYDEKCGVCGLSILKPLLATGGPGKNCLPASMNRCLSEACACACPNQSSLYKGITCCKGKHSEVWKEKSHDNANSQGNDAILFMCRHAYHSKCLPKDQAVCILCEGSR